MAIAEARPPRQARMGPWAKPTSPTRLQFRRRRLEEQSRCRPRQQAGLYRRARPVHLRPARRSRRAFFRRAARPRHPARGARADGAARHHRLADRVSRLSQGRHHRRAGQHAAHRRRLPLHAGRQPRQVPGGVGGAVSEIRKAHQGVARPRARHRVGQQSARLPAVRGSDRRRRAGGLHRADHVRRHGVLALHLGLDRQAERRGACAREPQAHRRSLRHAGCRHQGKRRLLFGGEIVLRLRARQCHDVPAVGRRHHRAQSPSGRRRTASPRCSRSIRSRCSMRCRPSMPPSWRARTRRRNPR